MRGGILAGGIVLGLLGAGAQAQMPEPRRLPPLSSITLSADSFDVRAFDPLGMGNRQAPSLAASAPAAPENGTPLREARAEIPGPASGLFSDGWSRDGFGARR